MSRSLIHSVVLGLAVVILLAPATVFADVLVLKNGDEVHGRFANRRLLRTDPLSLRHATIDAGTADQADIRAYPFEEIQYLIFEDDGEREVIDLAGLEEGVVTPTTRTVMEGYPPREVEVVTHAGPRDITTGVTLMVIGAGAIAVGAAVPFGEDHLVYGGGYYTTERQRNAGNWITVFAGSIVFVLGLYEVAKTRDQRAHPMFGYNTHGDAEVGMAVRF